MFLFNYLSFADFLFLSPFPSHEGVIEGLTIAWVSTHTSYGS